MVFFVTFIQKEQHLVLKKIAFSVNMVFFCGIHLLKIKIKKKHKATETELLCVYLNWSVYFRVKFA